MYYAKKRVALAFSVRLSLVKLPTMLLVVLDTV